MPQFDKITFFNQIFWLVLGFLSFYFIILKSLLPVLAASLKTRKKILNNTSFSGSSVDNSSRKYYYRSLGRTLKTYKTLFSTIAQKKASLSEVSKSQILSQTLFAK